MKPQTKAPSAPNQLSQQASQQGTIPSHSKFNEMIIDKPLDTNTLTHSRSVFWFGPERCEWVCKRAFHPFLPFIFPNFLAKHRPIRAETCAGISSELVFVIELTPNGNHYTTVVNRPFIPPKIEWYIPAVAGGHRACIIPNLKQVLSGQVLSGLRQKFAEFAKKTNLEKRQLRQYFQGNFWPPLVPFPLHFGFLLGFQLVFRLGQPFTIYHRFNGQVVYFDFDINYTHTCAIK